MLYVIKLLKAKGTTTLTLSNGKHRGLCMTNVK